MSLAELAEDLRTIVIALAVLLVARIVYVGIRGRAARAADREAMRHPTIEYIEQLIADGKRIEAVKAIRVRSGLSIPEAARVVEAVKRGEPLDIPESPH
jgi:ribosomal protein L7/L12